MADRLCKRCEKSMSREQSVVVLGRESCAYCLDCAVGIIAEDEWVVVTIDLLKRLRDGVL